MIFGFALIIIGAIFLIFVFLAIRNQFKEFDDPDTKPILINHMKQYSGGHAFLKVLEKEDSETRTKFVCVPRDLNAEQMKKLSKSGKLKPYTIYFKKDLVDLKDISDYVPTYEGFPDKIELLSEADKRDEGILNRIQKGNINSDMSKLYNTRLRALENGALNLAGNKVPIKIQEQLLAAYKDKIEVNHFIDKNKENN